MTKLLWENLKFFKLNYLYSFITVIIGITFLNYFHLSENYYLRFILSIFIFFPELKRLNEISKSGYYQFMNKLPISRDDKYKQKFIVSTSGKFLICLCISVINFFAVLSIQLMEMLRFTTSFLLALIIINNTTDLNNSPTKIYDQISKFGFLIAFCILYTYFRLLYYFITSDFCLLFGHSLIAINYLAFLIIQYVSSYYLSLAYYRRIIKTNFYKNYENNIDLKIQV